MQAVEPVRHRALHAAIHFIADLTVQPPIKRLEENKKHKTKLANCPLCSSKRIKNNLCADLSVHAVA